MRPRVSEMLQCGHSRHSTHPSALPFTVAVAAATLAASFCHKISRLSIKVSFTVHGQIRDMKTGITSNSSILVDPLAKFKGSFCQVESQLKKFF